MGDPFEGHYSKVTAMSEDGFVAAQMTDAIFAKMGEAVHRRNFRQMIEKVGEEKKTLFVNCWHMNEYESLAMWKLYAAQRESICIQSSFETLRELLPGEAYLGMVKYIDYNTEYIGVANTFNYIVHKRNSFEHERELRAVVWEPTLEGKYPIQNDSGIRIPIRADLLIENIFVNPNSDELLKEVVDGLKETYGLLAPVHKSNVNAGPDY